MTAPLGNRIGFTLPINTEIASKANGTAGGAPPQEVINLGPNEELIHAVSQHLIKANGGTFPEGATMKAKFERDEHGAIETELFTPPQNEYQPKTLITFWRTFTVDDGKGNIQTFRKQIFTNIAIPTPEEGPDAFQKALEAASMACSAYSKICNDAILVKGGGASRYNLDSSKVEELQRKNFIKIGKSIEEFKSKHRDMADIKIKIGQHSTTLNLDHTNLKGTSIKTRQKHFAIQNYTLSLLDHKIKQFKAIRLDAETFGKNYLTDPEITHSIATIQKNPLNLRGNLAKAGREAWEIYNESAQQNKANALLLSYAEYGKDLQQTVQDARNYCENQKLGFFYKRDLNKQIKVLEKMLKDLKSEFPEVHNAIHGKPGLPLNAPLQSVPEKSQQFQAFKREAATQSIHPSLQNDYAMQKVLSSQADKDITAQKSKIETVNKESQKETASTTQATKAQMDKKKKSLESVIKAEHMLLASFNIKKRAHETFLEGIKIMNETIGKESNQADAIAKMNEGNQLLKEASEEEIKARKALKAAQNNLNAPEETQPAKQRSKPSIDSLNAAIANHSDPFIKEHCGHLQTFFKESRELVELLRDELKTNKTAIDTTHEDTFTKETSALNAVLEEAILAERRYAAQILLELKNAIQTPPVLNQELHKTLQAERSKMSEKVKKAKEKAAQSLET